MALSPSTLIGPDKLPMIDKNIRALKTLAAEHDLAMQAGIGNPETGKRINDTLAKFQKIRQVYFPGQ
jgi:hypothetical protein